MYERHFGFSEKPFSLVPDPAFLYMGDKHAGAFQLLEYGLMNQAGFLAITGEIGTGKTTLIRHLLSNITDDVTIGLISNAHPAFGELLEWILTAFDLDVESTSKATLYKRFTDFVIGEYAQGRRVVLVVDEAQNLGPETLEELRLLSNINADKHQVLQLVLVGQPGLREHLQRPELAQLAQRISMDYHLTALDEDEVDEYIRHRLRVAGGSPDFFEPQACRAVARHSAGVPRLINLLCDTALVYAYGDRRQTVDLALIDEAAGDKGRSGISPLGRGSAGTGAGGNVGSGGR